MSEERLQKLLARAGAGSRRACERFIEEGRVTVNGRVAHLGDKADPARDAVLFDGDSVRAAASVLIALNKPCGYLSAMADDRGRRCVAELLPMGEHPSLFHVGRLDRDTSGLLLFTTDGALAQSLMHPSKEVLKTYVAQVEGRVRERELDQLRRGITLEDGPCSPAEADVLKPDGDGAEVRIVIHEGRKRQVRRMMEAIGHPIRTLSRVAIGAYELEGIPEGAWRVLEEGEAARLFQPPPWHRG